MKKLKDVTDEALEAELARRKKVKKEAATPQPLPRPDFTSLVAMVVENTKAIADDDEGAIALYDDFQHAVYEAAIECIYGRRYWRWAQDKMS